VRRVPPGRLGHYRATAGPATHRAQRRFPVDRNPSSGPSGAVAPCTLVTATETSATKRYTCGHRRPRDQFHREARRKDGLDPRCSSCRAVARRQGPAGTTLSVALRPRARRRPAPRAGRRPAVWPRPSPLRGPPPWRPLWRSSARRGSAKAGRRRSLRPGAHGKTPTTARTPSPATRRSPCWPPLPDGIHERGTHARTRRRSPTMPPS